MSRYKFICVAAAGVLFLSACGDKKTEVKGEFGQEPSLSIQNVIKVKELELETLKAGDGAEVKQGDIVTYHIAFFNGTTGKKIDDGGFGTDKKIEAYMAGAGSYLDRVFIGAKVGSRITAKMPAGFLTGSAKPTKGYNKEDNLLAVYDLLGIIPAKLTGQVAAPEAGMPVVVDSETGQPQVMTPGGDAPTELKVQTLIKGEGAVVDPYDRVTVNYLGVFWDGKVFDSSWGRGAPADLSVSGVIKGVQQGLIGQKVGSRILMVIPPELGYGDRDQGSIPANSTLIFVFDVLWAYKP